MKIIKEIRLKKDTPDHRAGELFVLMSNNGIYEIDAGEDDPAVFYGGDIDNFDEWFEVVDEPKYLRRRIKELSFGDKNEVEIVFRFIKDWYYYYYDEATSNGMFNGYDEGTVERLGLGRKNEVFAIGIAIKGLNQMVDDGYIEIEDNPDIVWREK